MTAGPKLTRSNGLRAGSDPDPRFSLANERTFLAWIRTVLAIIAGALALEALGDTIVSSGTRSILTHVLLAVAVLLAILAWRRWYRVEVALRLKRSLPLPKELLALSLLLASGGIILAVTLQA
ncbi:YidH family protein [Rhodococcus gannanensis]|uniref:YidH family protein n=1 Tax=Rhodococcus gannanensis TaxID=1960308 RepID=A0ABW4P112_9NOCA